MPEILMDKLCPLGENSHQRRPAKFQNSSLSFLAWLWNHLHFPVQVGPMWIGDISYIYILSLLPKFFLTLLSLGGEETNIDQHAWPNSCSVP